MLSSININELTNIDRVFQENYVVIASIYVMLWPFFVSIRRNARNAIMIANKELLASYIFY